MGGNQVYRASDRARAGAAGKKEKRPEALAPMAKVGRNHKKILWISQVPVATHARARAHTHAHTQTHTPPCTQTNLEQFIKENTVILNKKKQKKVEKHAPRTM